MGTGHKSHRIAPLNRGTRPLLRREPRSEAFGHVRVDESRAQRDNLERESFQWIKCVCVCKYGCISRARGNRFRARRGTPGEAHPPTHLDRFNGKFGGLDNHVVRDRFYRRALHQHQGPPWRARVVMTAELGIQARPLGQDRRRRTCVAS